MALGKTFQKVLALETSCDDTSVAIIDHSGRVWACTSANQDLKHQPFGGIVPEIASREHSEHLLPLIEVTMNKAQVQWKDIDGIVATSRPGLMGSLMVGVVTAKSLAMAHGCAWLGVNHIEGHILAPMLTDEKYQPPSGFQYPFVSLVVSGGHSHLFLVKGLGQYQILGRTVDDAAGEAFDKFAKLMGLGYPGGVAVDRLATQGNPRKFDFPRGMIHEPHLDFSFSGLKTAAARVLSTMTADEIEAQKADLCASYQQAIVDVLIQKLERAVKAHAVKCFSLTGGVSANSGLRRAAEAMAERCGWTLAVPPLRYCTDNAAMIGLVGIKRLNQGESSTWSEGPSPSSLEKDFQ